MEIWEDEEWWEEGSKVSLGSESVDGRREFFGSAELEREGGLERRMTWVWDSRSVV